MVDPLDPVQDRLAEDDIERAVVGQRTIEMLRRRFDE
jgi:hypothetical protein